MHQITAIRLQLCALVEDFATAHMHLREAETSAPDLARMSLSDASECIANLSADLAMVDAAIQRQLENLPL